MTMFHVSSRDLVWVLKWPVLGGWKRDLHLGESPLVAKVTSRESPQIICRLKWHKSVEIHGKNPPKVEKKYTSPPPKKTKKQKQWKKCGQYLSNGEREGNPQNVWEVFHPPFVVLSRPFSSLALRGCGESLWPVWSSVGFTPWVGRGSCERPCCCKLLFFWCTSC